jgi:hypothetical protein
VIDVIGVEGGSRTRMFRRTNLKALEGSTKSNESRNDVAVPAGEWALRRANSQASSRAGMESTSKAISRPVVRVLFARLETKC